MSERVKTVLQGIGLLTLALLTMSAESIADIIFGAF